MQRSTRWLYGIAYFCSRSMGLFAITYDLESGKARLSTLNSIYSGFMGLVMFCVVLLLTQIKLRSRNKKGSYLHFYINQLLIVMRILAVLLSMLLNWRKRHEQLSTINRFGWLRRKFGKRFYISAEIQNQFECSMRRKLSWALLCSMVIFASSYDLMKLVFDTEQHLILLAVSLISTGLTIQLSYYCFALLNVNTYFQHINKELKKILDATSLLFEQHCYGRIKPARLMTQCCKLSDDLDQLAWYQFRFQKTVDAVNDMYQVQGACVILNIYLNNIAVIYMSYMYSEHLDMASDHGPWLLVLFVLGLLVFYMDLRNSLFIILKVQQLERKTAALLKDEQPWLPMLDERLEQSVSDKCSFFYKFHLNILLPIAA